MPVLNLILELELGAGFGDRLLVSRMLSFEKKHHQYFCCHSEPVGGSRCSGDSNIAEGGGGEFPLTCDLYLWTGS